MAFTDMLRIVLQDHNAVIQTMALGVLELQHEVGAEVYHQEMARGVNTILDRFFMARIGLRFLIEHHISSQRLPGQEDVDDGYAGIIRRPSGKFEAYAPWKSGKRGRSLGFYQTAVDAALAVAKNRDKDAPPPQQLLRAGSAPPAPRQELYMLHYLYHTYHALLSYTPQRLGKEFVRFNQAGAPRRLQLLCAPRECPSHQLVGSHHVIIM